MDIAETGTVKSANKFDALEEDPLTISSAVSKVPF